MLERKLFTTTDRFISLPFGRAIGAWIETAKEEFILKHPLVASSITQEMWLSLEKELFNRLSSILALSINFEIAVSRLKNELSGETPENRYDDFLDKTLCTPSGFNAFFSKYPILLSLLENAVHLWIDSTRLLIERLMADLPTLQSTFFKEIPIGAITAISTGLSDPHKEGKVTVIIEFASGQKVVYKPRDMQLEQAYSELLNQLNKKGLSPEMRPLRLLNKGTYGWAEYVTHEPCRDINAVKRFYERMGVHICLFYLLQGTDAHNENFIASGEHPMVIDAEILCSPRASSGFSVLDTLFLPFYLANGLGQSMQVGGLVAETGNSFESIPDWSSPNTDEVHLNGLMTKAKASAHVPYTQENHHVQGFVQQITVGFKKTYELISNHREWLCKDPDAFVSSVQGAPVRVVLRRTSAYAKLLRRLTDPECLADPKAYNAALDQLSLYGIYSQDKYQLAVKSEQEALRRGDVPIFYAKTNSLDLFQEDGKMVVPMTTLKTSIEGITKRIQEMNEQTMKLQIGYIKASFSALKQESHATTNEQIKPSYVPSSFSGIFDDETLLEHATQIAESIMQQAENTEDDHLLWIAAEPTADLSAQSFQKISNNLYSGTAGIALFFAALSNIKQCQKWAENAKRIVKPFREAISSSDISLLLHPGAVSAMVGGISIAYVLAHMGELLQDHTFTEDAYKLINTLSYELIDSDSLFDLILGNAGIILVLLSLYEKNEDPQLLKKALYAGDHLIKHAVISPAGQSVWYTVCKERVLTGWLHGMSGIAYALIKLGYLSKEERFYKIATEALAYERACFNKEKNNWPDFRKEGDNYCCALCHGATGIGIGRIATLPYLKDSLLNEEISIAIQTTLNSMNQQRDSYTLCCGELGRIELLRVASLALKKPELHTQALRSLLLLVTQAQRHREGLSEELVSWSHPGFFKGTSGLGYALLKFHNKGDKLPNVSLLE